MSGVPEKLPTPASFRPYTAEEVYGLVDGKSRTQTAACELAKAFDGLPYDVGGVAVHNQAVHGLPDGSQVKVIAFNGRLSADDRAVLRKPTYEKLTEKDRAYALLNDEQREAKRSVKPGIVQRLGRLTTNGVVSGGSGVGVFKLVEGAGTGLENSITLGSMVGLAAAGIVYGAGRYHYRKRERQQATRFIEDVKERFFDDDDCVPFLPNKVHSILLDDPDTTSGDAPNHTSYLAQLNDRYNGAVKLNIQPEPVADVMPALIVKEALRRDKRPLELWNSEFGDMAKEMSDAEMNVLLAERALEAAQEREDFTSIRRPDEIDAYRVQIRNAQAELISITVAAMKFCEERHAKQKQVDRIQKAEQAINEILRTENVEPHPLEMQLQTLTSIVSRSLSNLELSDEATHKTVKFVADYLKGTRTLLTDRQQIGQFYEGLYDKFAELLPGLPAWEAAKEQFEPGGTKN